jgi:hypothetical protein
MSFLRRCLCKSNSKKTQYDYDDTEPFPEYEPVALHNVNNEDDSLNLKQKVKKEYKKHNNYRTLSKQLRKQNQISNQLEYKLIKLKQLIYKKCYEIEQARLPIPVDPVNPIDEDNFKNSDPCKNCEEKDNSVCETYLHSESSKNYEECKEKNNSAPSNPPDSCELSEPSEPSEPSKNYEEKENSETSAPTDTCETSVPPELSDTCETSVPPELSDTCETSVTVESGLNINLHLESESEETNVVTTSVLESQSVLHERSNDNWNCTFIIKSGSNRGHHCKNKRAKGEIYCARHK